MKLRVTLHRVSFLLYTAHTKCSSTIPYPSQTHYFYMYIYIYIYQKPKNSVVWVGET